MYYSLMRSWARKGDLRAQKVRRRTQALGQPALPFGGARVACEGRGRRSCFCA